MERVTPTEIAAIKQEVSSSLRCALPGNVESFDEASRTAVIRPAVRGMPLLRDVPVFMPWRFDVFPGDPCLVIFADRDIDAWYDTGGAEDPPSGRTHSLSDGFAFVGFRTRT